MDKSATNILTTSFNIKRWESHGINMRRFLEHVKSFGASVWIAETVFGEHDYEFDKIPGVNHVGFRTRSPIWAKERSINQAITRFNENWKYLICVDGDITFKNENWIAATLDALQHFDWVWPWATCYDLGPHGEHMELHRSFGYQWTHDPISCEKMGKGYTFAHPGYAFATTRATLEKMGGIIDTAVLGAADHHSALSLIGKAHLSFPGNISEAYKRPILQWQDRAITHINGNIGYVPGTIEHCYHGTKSSRKYIDRWKILSENGFDPSADLKVNTSGMWELTGSKPKLKRDLMSYFSGRDEDSTTISAARKLLNI